MYSCVVVSLGIFKAVSREMLLSLLFFSLDRFSFAALFSRRNAGLVSPAPHAKNTHLILDDPTSRGDGEGIEVAIVGLWTPMSSGRRCRGLEHPMIAPLVICN